jgi:hypothetical protein
MNPIDLLDQLAELRAASDISRLEYEAQRNIILQPVQDELRALDSEFNPMFNTVAERISELETQVKELVLAGGESVKGANLHAVYMRGRVSWETAKLEGFLVAHPELESLRKVGEPSVQIRNVK